MKPILDPANKDFDAYKANMWIAEHLFGWTYDPLEYPNGQVANRWIDIDERYVLKPDFYHENLIGKLQSRLWEECCSGGVKHPLNIWRDKIHGVERCQVAIYEEDGMDQLTFLSEHKSLPVALILALVEMKYYKQAEAEKLREMDEAELGDK